MDFSAPWRVATPTLEGPVLKALAGVESALTRAQIVAVIGDASEAGVRKALARLVDQGIVVEERLGGRYSYQGNRDHLLWPAIDVLLNPRGLLRARIAQLVSTWEIAPLSIGLFGSIAQGTSDEESDVDLLVVRPSLGPADLDMWESQIDSLHDHVVSWTGNGCDIVVMDPSQVRAAAPGRDPVLSSPMSTLVGQSYQDLARTLQDAASAGLDDLARSLSERVKAESGATLAAISASLPRTLTQPLVEAQRGRVPRSTDEAAMAAPGAH